MITVNKVEKLKPKEKRYTVKIASSLYLRVTQTGHKSYVFRYYNYGKVKDLTLGVFPDMTPQQAAQVAHLKRAELDIKPSDGITVGAVYKIWKQQKRHLKNFKNERRKIENNLLPDLKNKEIDKLTVPFMFEFLIQFKDKPITLKFLLMRFKEMMRIATKFGLLKFNPFVELTFKDFVPKYIPKRRPYIPAEKLSDLFNELNVKNSPNWLRYFLLFCIYALLRPKEASRIKHSFIKNGILTIPFDEMKEGREHRLPICPEVMKLLELVKIEQKLKVLKYNARLKKDEPHKRQSRFVWAFGHHLRPIGKQYLAKWIRSTSFCGKCCAHGFRTTGREWLKDAGVNFEILEDALSHVVGEQSSRRYIPTDYLKTRIPIMQKWWNYVYKNYCAVCAPVAGLSSDS